MTTKQAAPATPLPWGHDDFDNAERSYKIDSKRTRIECVTIYGRGGDEIARFCHEPDNNLDAFGSDARADAAYIVEACNNFPRLMAEREQLVAALRFLWIATENTLCERSESQIEASFKARALLAKLGSE